ncbi:unnamed protein product [Acanthoscelides obtectus]|uniref:Uncharacterized protein n=1 Tax=Acanthoscelides obtectus TaxID=200917 RepID=A0A9P0PFU5_ACAOB|nr:unnamed protein product [Acanthoscelides obtectus]CAK1638227.1 hypothetical protein AOBTE_LOCUS10466 [Acanthoscelides obtectus]
MSSSKKIQIGTYKYQNNISLQTLNLDESTDVFGTSQMAVFVRMVFNDFTVKKNLLRLIPLKEQTTGRTCFLLLKIIFLLRKFQYRKW